MLSKKLRELICGPPPKRARGVEIYICKETSKKKPTEKNSEADRRLYSSWEGKPEEGFLLEWLETPGNYGKWMCSAGRKKGDQRKGFSGKKKIVICQEIVEYLEEKGVHDRDAKAVKNKVITMERSWKKAHNWLETTGEGIKSRELKLRDPNILGKLHTKCAIFERLDAIFKQHLIMAAPFVALNSDGVADATVFLLVARTTESAAGEQLGERGTADMDIADQQKKQVEDFEGETTGAHDTSLDGFMDSDSDSETEEKPGSNKHGRAGAPVKPGKSGIKLREEVLQKMDEEKDERRKKSELSAQKKLDNTEASRKDQIDLRKEELQLRRTELEIRKFEAENQRMLIKLQMAKFIGQDVMEND